MRVAVYGASGFTGGFAIAEAHQRGFAPVLVGRDEKRLREAAERSGAAGAEIRVAGLDEPAKLAAAFSDCDAVVNCAGPFTLWGEQVVRAAIAAGRPYVDTAGEQGFIRRVLTDVDENARRAGVTVVPGMADDGGPGDLIAHLAAARLTTAPVAEMLVADLRLPGKASRGTARSMFSVFERGPVDYVDGEWLPADDSGPATLVPPGQVEPVAVQPFALPGVVTVPAHVQTPRVRTVLRSDVAVGFTGLTADVVESVPETVDAETRRAGRWLMLAEATGADGRRARGWVTGDDGYRLTAVIAVEGARRLAAGGVRAGALTPAQAFDPTGFLDFLTPYGVSWELTGGSAD
jgi:short subunit dehydrogenase-like uncharacterized protein